jgi:NADPH:quinone reductase-like Zn-dependent oxidoreductase
MDFKMLRHGTHIKKYPVVLGSDISGTIVRSNSEHLNKGDNICAFTKMGTQEWGGFQEYCLVSGDMVIKLPQDYDLNAASTFPMGTYTAALGLFHWMRIPQPPKNTSGKILVWGASSSVGQYVVQLAKMAGLTVVGVCSQRNFEHVKRLGADHVFDYNNKMIDQDLTNNGPFDYGFDCIGAETANRAIKHIREGGQFAFCNEGPSQRKGIQVHQVNLDNAYDDNNCRQFLSEFSRHLANWIRDKRIQPNRVEKVQGGLSGVHEGLERMESGRVSCYKLVAVISETR